MPCMVRTLFLVARRQCADLLIDTDPNAPPADPLAALEKSTDAQNHMNKVQVPRLEALQSLSDHYGNDPYSLSRKVRKRFREVKKVEKAQEAADDQVKGRFGLPEELKLSAETEETRLQAKEEWARAQKELVTRESKRRRIEAIHRPSSSSSSSRASGASGSGVSAADLLRARILGNTARRRPAPSTSRK